MRGRQFSHLSLRIYHCAFTIVHLSLNIGDDIYGITSSKSAIRNSKSEIGIAKTMKT